MMYKVFQCFVDVLRRTLNRICFPFLTFSLFPDPDDKAFLESEDDGIKKSGSNFESSTLLSADSCCCIVEFTRCNINSSVCRLLVHCHLACVSRSSSTVSRNYTFRCIFLFWICCLIFLYCVFNSNPLDAFSCYAVCPFSIAATANANHFLLLHPCCEYIKNL